MPLPGCKPEGQSHNSYRCGLPERMVPAYKITRMGFYRTHQGQYPDATGQQRRILVQASGITGQQQARISGTGYTCPFGICPMGTVAKLAMRQPFVLFKGLTFQKLCLPGAFRPGDHHNKMLRPGLCVVHASPQYL